MKKKANPVNQKRPSPLLYFFAGLYFKAYCKSHFGLQTKGIVPKGPALILSNHTSNHDYKFIACAAFPTRVTFLSTYHWFTFKKLAPWLKRIGAIPKYQFTTDLESIKKIRNVVKEKKGVVFIAPEGTVYASGALGYISPAIAKMIRFLKVPVYASKIQGAGLGNAKWSTYPHKCQVSVQTSLLFNAEEAVSLEINQIMDRIKQALTYDEFVFQKENNIKIEGNDKALGFETMFYKCPCCHKEFTLRTEGNVVICTHCGAKATFTEDFTFKWKGEKQYFENYRQWYDWQYELVKQEVQKPDFLLEDDVDYAIDESGVDNCVVIGTGKMRFSHEGWRYEGTYKGEQVIQEDSVKSVFLATLKIGKHFELPFKYGHCRTFYPLSNPLSAMKWHLCSRAMSEIEENQ